MKKFIQITPRLNGEVSKYILEQCKKEGQPNFSYWLNCKLKKVFKLEKRNNAKKR